VRRLGSFRVYAAAVVVVAVLAAVALPRESSAAARVARLEALVRCPSCEDLSVAQSSASSALAVRHQIAAGVSRGESDTAILTSLEDAYGPSILLSPPTTGLGALLWAVPAAVIAVAVAVAVRLARRR
jgi:cytochrome c-type biogenesis protein CcmH